MPPLFHLGDSKPQISTPHSSCSHALPALSPVFYSEKKRGVVNAGARICHSAPSLPNPSQHHPALSSPDRALNLTIFPHSLFLDPPNIKGGSSTRKVPTPFSSEFPGLVQTTGQPPYQVDSHYWSLTDS